jgi:hypothetical protein
MLELFSDLTVDELNLGVKRFCLETKEIYPGTNIIAHIRGYGKPEKTFEQIAKERWEARK